MTLSFRSIVLKHGAGVVVLSALASGAGLVGCHHDHDHRDRTPDTVVIRDEHGFDHRGYYDERHAWHGGYYDERKLFHDDAPEWGHGREQMAQHDEHHDDREDHDRH